MDLKFLKSKCCPICGATQIIGETIKSSNFKIDTHCNGTQWETRTFICGQKVEFIPNFNKDINSDYETCKINADYITKINRRKEARKNIFEYIKNLDVDDDYKIKISMYVQ